MYCQYICNTIPTEEETAPTIDTGASVAEEAGAEEFPVATTKNTVQFFWFRLENSENAAYYTQFIAALCKTAMEKKHVTAKAAEHFENERFTMRVWLIGLGLVGKAFKLIRRLLCQPLSGNAAWRYGKPEKKATPASEEAGTANE